MSNLSTATTRTFIISEGRTLTASRVHGVRGWLITEGPDEIMSERFDNFDDLRQSLRDRGYADFRRSYKG